MKTTLLDQINFLTRLVRQEGHFHPVNVALIKGYMKVMNLDFRCGLQEALGRRQGIPD